MCPTTPVIISRSFTQSRRYWPDSEQHVIDALERHTDEHGIIRVNTVKFGRWVTQDPATSPARAYARGIEWLFLHARRAQLETLGPANSHRADYLFKFRPTPPPTQRTSMEINLDHLHDLAPAGNALHFFLWLAARSTQRDDAIAIYTRGDYGPDEHAHLAHLESLGWVTSCRQDQDTHVTPHTIKTSTYR